MKTASDELIAMAEGMATLTRDGGASGYAIVGMFERLIARIRQQDDTIKRLEPYAEAQAKYHDEQALHYRDAYRLFAGTEGHLKLSEEHAAKAVEARAARKEQP